MSHAVEVLPVHEKDQQHCIYDETHDAESVVARNQKTKLISFFLACAQGLTGIDGVPAKNCLYLDFPQYFRFDQKTKLWVGRMNHIKVIGRIDLVSPRQKERFYIRTCFAISMDQLPSKICAQFTELCIQRSDASWTVIPGLLSSAVVLSRHRVLENNMTSYFGDRGDGITQFQR
ncbi:hypothetical protein DYB26_016457 [Aphanomyces astaci]|uniref:Uncharacterized protein n=1 Tax=Aphanomyces astaci TaxID=112090 RepID=A0A3R6X082_APHAT|nr:hypothetical protein DYB26_016457 [Aphanomyces astaci]